VVAVERSRMGRIEPALRGILRVVKPHAHVKGLSRREERNAL
jgi:hypothetical protein